MPLAAILLILGGLLSGLLFVAFVQRRGSEAMAMSPGMYFNEPQAGFDASSLQGQFNARSTQQTWTLMSIGRIALGVWLGMWLFVFTAAIPAVIIFRTWVDHRP